MLLTNPNPSDQSHDQKHKAKLPALAPSQPVQQFAIALAKLVTGGIGDAQGCAVFQAFGVGGFGLLGVDGGHGVVLG